MAPVGRYRRSLLFTQTLSKKTGATPAQLHTTARIASEVMSRIITPPTIPHVAVTVATAATTASARSPFSGQEFQLTAEEAQYYEGLQLTEEQEALRERMRALARKREQRARWVGEGVVLAFLPFLPFLPFLRALFLFFGMFPPPPSPSVQYPPRWGRGRLGNGGVDGYFPSALSVQCRLFALLFPHVACIDTCAQVVGSDGGSNGCRAKASAICSGRALLYPVMFVDPNQKPTFQKRSPSRSLPDFGAP